MTNEAQKRPFLSFIFLLKLIRAFLAPSITVTPNNILGIEEFPAE
jgi:hypothetical protein